MHLSSCMSRYRVPEMVKPRYTKLRTTISHTQMPWLWCGECDTGHLSHQRAVIFVVSGPTVSALCGPELHQTNFIIWELLFKLLSWESASCCLTWVFLLMSCKGSDNGINREVKFSQTHHTLLGLCSKPGEVTGASYQTCKKIEYFHERSEVLFQQDCK